MFDGGNVIAEYDHDNFLLRKYIYGPGVDEPVCMIDPVENTRQLDGALVRAEPAAARKPEGRERPAEGQRGS